MHRLAKDAIVHPVPASVVVEPQLYGGRTLAQLKEEREKRFKDEAAKRAAKAPAKPAPVKPAPLPASASASQRAAYFVALEEYNSAPAPSPARPAVRVRA